MNVPIMNLKIAVAQINVVVGDLPGNVERIAGYAERARLAGADLLLLPELALTGYPPEDLLLRPDFYTASRAALDDLAVRTAGIAVLVGFPVSEEDGNYNAVALLDDGRAQTVCRKQILPNDEVFDEKRYFTAGDSPCVIDFKGVRCGVAICADLWEDGPGEKLRDAGAELILSLNASPYHHGKVVERIALFGERARAVGLPLLYVNMVGGQDELVFDGGSFALDAMGEVTWRAPLFDPLCALVEFRQQGPRRFFAPPKDYSEPPVLSAEAEVYQALVVGLRDYVEKNRFPGVVIGLSGGIDSALVAAIAVDALGPDRVDTLMLASPYTVEMSIDDARLVARALGVRHEEIPIEAPMEVFDALLIPVFSALPPPGAQDATFENIQARIRGLILMAFSNRTGALVLTTSNKSETAVGYSTLYGDMAGGFAVLKDVVKTLVYRLARYRNSIAQVIPERIFTRPPSAELRPDQTDQDSLPPYEELDEIIEAYVGQNRDRQYMLDLGLPAEAVDRTVRLLHQAEYKRRQGPPGTRITWRGFGKDWRYPITNRFSF